MNGMSSVYRLFPVFLLLGVALGTASPVRARREALRPNHPLQQSATPRPPGGTPQPAPAGVCPSKGARQVQAHRLDLPYPAASPYLSHGFLSSGQSADLLLSGIDFDDAGGPLLFNHPAGIAGEGGVLAVADRNNNRVLLWLRPPDNGTPPDLVLGQPDFQGITPGTGMADMNWPSAVSIGGGHLAVADTENHRLLLWTTLPTRSGQPADVAVSLTALRNQLPRPRNLQWPWGVWTDGRRLVAAATHGPGLLIWNSLPVTGREAPDLVVADSRMGTPRQISSDGNWLAVWDHNARLGVGGDGRGTFIYHAFPTAADQQADVLLPFQAVGVGLPGGGLLAVGDGLMRFDALPDADGVRPDWVSRAANIGSQDGLGVALLGERVYLLDGNGNKVVGYDALPTEVQAPPDLLLGAAELCANSLDEHFIFSNPVPATDGRRLFVSSDFDSKLYVWERIPDRNNAAPDWIYDLDVAPWDNAIWGDTFVLAGKNTVTVWKSLPLEGRLPDLQYRGGIGNAIFQELTGVALDDRYLYLADGRAGRIHVWEGLPAPDEDPLVTIETGPAVARLNSDGEYLAAVVNGGGGGAPVRLWSVDGIASGAAPREVRSGTGFQMNLPGSAMTVDGRLLVADTVWSRILGWDSIDAAVRGERPSLLLGTHSLDDHVPEIGRDRLYWPATMAIGGGYFWVGEFKFSMRLLRFDLPPGDVVASPTPQVKEATPTPAAGPERRLWLPVLNAG